MVVAESSRSRVRCDDRTGRELEDVLDAGCAEVRHVEDDAEAVHLAEDYNAGSRQSTTRLILAAAVCEQRATHVGEGDHPNAELVEDLEEAFVGSKRKRALHRDDERDLPLIQGRVDFAAGTADRKISRVQVGLTLERRDLAQCLAQVRFRDLRIAVERADLDIDAACTELGKPPVLERASFAQARPGNRQHEIVVRVDHHGLPMNPACIVRLRGVAARLQSRSSVVGHGDQITFGQQWSNPADPIPRSTSWVNCCVVESDNECQTGEMKEHWAGLEPGNARFEMRLAPYVREAVVMEPDEAMLHEGRKRAASAGVKNLSFVLGSSDDLPRLKSSAGEFASVVISQAVHWMRDQDSVLGTLSEMVDTRRGAVALIG
jgi:hypothetical protein